MKKNQQLLHKINMKNVGMKLLKKLIKKKKKKLQNMKIQKFHL